jgi:hypothetical protein
MRALVTNFGYRRSFPTCIGDIFIPRNQAVEIEDRQALKELKSFPHIKVEILEADPKVDYSGYSINQLRNIASQLGHEGTFKMRKVDIINLLEENYATV